VPTGTETFDMNATVEAVLNAMSVVACSVGFQAAVHGLILAFIIAVIGVMFVRQNRPTGKPLIAVSKKVAIFCAVLAIPGVISLATTGGLPAPGAMQINSFGLLVFWSLVIAHLCMEEMNFEWFQTEK
jgi:hypothetical protein